MQTDFSIFSYAYGTPSIRAEFRRHPEDFVVTEILPEEPFSGEGEHLCLHIKKRDQNTRWVAGLLAKIYDVSETAIGYCGLKDRRAVTTQWFSVHLPGTAIFELPQLGDDIKVLSHTRHHKKLRRGDHTGNHFSILLRDLMPVDESVSNTAQQIIARLHDVQRAGVPNYFGEQRFGHDGNNLLEAEKLLSKINQNHQQGNNRRGRRNKKGFPDKQGLYLSAARSWLFNLVLSGRIDVSGWQMLPAEATGPLWGRGRSPVDAETRDLEQQILADHTEWLHAMEFTGLTQERRPLRMIPEQLSWEIEEQNLRLRFFLPKGQFATSVLRELVLLDTPQKTPVL